MQLIVASVLILAVSADRLENTYLPPKGAQGAGGSSSLLAPPISSNNNKVTSGISSSFSSASSGKTQQSQYNSAANPPIAILRYENTNNGDGTYKFEYETENHISHQESGQLKNAGTEHESSVVQGSYSFTAPDGVTYTINYIANENGFQAIGDHIPTPPPTPEAILKSLQVIAAAEASGAQTSGGGQYQSSSSSSQGQFSSSSASSGHYQQSSQGQVSGSSSSSGYHY